MIKKNQWSIRYTAAVAAVAGAYLLRQGLVRLVGAELPPYITFYPLVMIVALLTGFGPALLATVLAALATAWLIFPPQPPPVAALGNLVSLGLFAGMGIFMSGVAWLYRRNREKAAAYDREAALRESRERLASFASATFEGIVEVEDGRIVDCNDHYAAMHGWSVAELKGRPVAELVAPEERERVAASMRAAGEGDVLIELEALRRDGSRIVVEVHGRPVPGTGRSHAALREITERRRAHEEVQRAAGALQEANAELAQSRRATLNLLEDALEARRQAEQATGELRASEERLRVLSDQIPGGALYQHVLHPDGRFEYAYLSAGIEGLFGIPPAEVMADPERFRRLILEEDLPLIAAAEERSVRELTLFDCEFRQRTVAGAVKWVQCRSVPRLQEDGSVVWYGIVLDITGRKLAEEALQQAHAELALQVEERVNELREKEVLLKEVHHRVKNNLQVISSLVSLQADGSADPLVREVLQDVTFRVRSMALVHEKLYQSESLALVNFGEYTQSLLSYLWRAHGAMAAKITLRLDLEPVQLPVDTAMPCGLILNELAGNALKHAFRDREAGEVTVALHGGEEGEVCLTVRDDGVGLPPGLQWQASKSLGLRLVQILAGQLRAEISVANGKGTAFTLRTKVSSAGSAAAVRTEQHGQTTAGAAARGSSHE